MDIKSPLWYIHKKIQSEYLLTICKSLQKRYLNRQKLINEYHIVILNRAKAVDFIISNRTIITTLFDKTLVREFILNYRTRYTKGRPNKLFSDYVKYVTTKNKRHSSDIAIAYNLIKYVDITHEQKVWLVDHIIELLNDVPEYVRTISDDLFNIKMYLVMEIVRKRGIVTQ